jgi:hypothetical protein
MGCAVSSPARRLMDLIEKRNAVVDRRGGGCAAVRGTDKAC